MSCASAKTLNNLPDTVKNSAFLTTSKTRFQPFLFNLIIIIINRFVWRHKVITSEALGSDSVSVSRERREGLGEDL